MSTELQQEDRPILPAGVRQLGDVKYTEGELEAAIRTASLSLDPNTRKRVVLRRLEKKGVSSS